MRRVSTSTQGAGWHHPSFPPGFSDVSGLITKPWCRALRDYHLPVSRKTEDPSAKFRLLADEWKNRTRYQSSATNLILDDAYQQIIGMGTPAIPLLLRALREAPDHWGWALHCITGANPVPPEAAGDLRSIAAAWLRWGEERGYVTRT